MPRNPDSAALALPAEGRVFRHRDRATLADVSPAGRARLDALARWLQDAAYDDARDSGLDDSGVWIVRRLALRVLRFPRFDEAIEVATFCSGAAPLWAERSSLVSCDGEVAVEAVALWVHLQPDGVRPQPLPAGFDAIYGPSAARPPRARAAAPSAAAARRRARRGRGSSAAPTSTSPATSTTPSTGRRSRTSSSSASRRRGLEAEIEHRAAATRARRPCSPTASSAGSWTRTARSSRRSAPRRSAEAAQLAGSS